MTLRWTDEEERRLIAALNEPRNELHEALRWVLWVRVVVGVVLVFVIWWVGSGL